MKHACFVSLFLCLTTTFLLSQSNPVPLINQSTSVGVPISASQADPKAQAKILDSYGKLPLSFEANHGQTDARVKFLSRTSGYSLFLTGDEAVLALSGKKTDTKAEIAGASHASKPRTTAPKAGGVLRMKLRNANPAAKVTGVDELAGTSNYFIGNDPAKWPTNVPTYAKVKYEGIYPGIDLAYYGNQRQLEYDFIVAPGADPRRIAFDVRGAKRIRQDAHGDLVFKVGDGEIRWHKPVVYQEKDGAQQEIVARYAITNTNRVGFELAKYDASRPLYIDPLIYSTFLGGNGDDAGDSIVVDNAGNAYVAGLTESTNFPTMNPLQPTYGGGTSDVFITKINATGSALVYSTYLGGSSSDAGARIAVDGSGSVYISGYTSSTDFPIANALQTTFGGGNTDAFVAKINPTGSALVYSTYLGGSGDDIGNGIAVDSSGNAYVTGQTGSTDFPTMNPLQPTYAGGYDAFVAKINPTGSALIYSTYLGGSAQDDASGIAVDSSGNVYIGGITASTNFPTMNPLQPTYGGGQYDAFLAKINAAGSALVYSTYLGGSDFDVSTGLAVDGGGNAYVTGQTFSTDFPTTPGAFQTAFGGVTKNCYTVAGDAFLTKINATGSALVYSTYLGGNCYDAGLGLAVDSSGDAYVTGNTTSANFPTTPGAFQTTCGGAKVCAKGFGFVTELNPMGSALVYSTYLGSGIAGKCSNCFPYNGAIAITVDSFGSAYVTGATESPGFPTVNPLQSTLGGGTDAFVTKLTYAASTTDLISSVNPSVSGKPVTFTAKVSSPSGGTPTGKVSFRNGNTVLGAKTLSGGTVSFTTSSLPLGLNSITAVYGGDSNFSSSTSSPVNQVVLAATTTTLSSSLNPSIYGQAVTFTAEVTSSAGAPPDGETVTFKKGTTILGTGTLSGGSATFTISTLPVATNAITAVYGGDSNFGGSKSQAVSQVVNKATTTTTLASSLNPSKVGQSVTFTASVTPQFSGKVTGTVSFYDGTTILKTATLSGGAAKLTTSTLTHGTHTITATYNGGTSFIGSSASLTQTVN